MAGTLVLAGAAGLARAGDPAGSSRAAPALIGAAGAGFGQSPRLVSLGRLLQRASIITGFSWLTALSARALHREPAAPSVKRARGDRRG